LPSATPYATPRTGGARTGTRYIVSKYRVVSKYVTQLDVDYYDDQGSLVTTISYPTRYLKSVETVLVKIETHASPSPEGSPATNRLGLARRQSELAPIV